MKMKELARKASAEKESELKIKALEFIRNTLMDLMAQTVLKKEGRIAKISSHESSVDTIIEIELLDYITEGFKELIELVIKSRDDLEPKGVD